MQLSINGQRLDADDALRSHITEMTACTDTVSGAVSAGRVDPRAERDTGA